MHNHWNAFGCQRPIDLHIFSAYGFIWLAGAINWRSPAQARAPVVWVFALVPPKGESHALPRSYMHPLMCFLMSDDSMKHRSQLVVLWQVFSQCSLRLSPVLYFQMWRICKYGNAWLTPISKDRMVHNTNAYSCCWFFMGGNPGIPGGAFIGRRTVRLIGEVLSKGADAQSIADLLEHADGVVAALNIYRFLLLRESSGTWHLEMEISCSSQLLARVNPISLTDFHSLVVDEAHIWW